VALTEFNLNWLVCWASTHQFDIDPQVTALFALITAAEHQTPPLTLCVSDSGELYISDAPDSLSCHIVDQGLTMHVNNMLPVLDKCAELGVSVSTDALAQAKLQHPAMSEVFWDLCLIRDGKTTDTDCIPEIFNYADQMQRWPVVIYEPDASHTLLQWLLANYPLHHIANTQHSESWCADTRYIYTKKPLRNIDTIPLLISTAGMIHGPEKILMWQKARKIVYTVPEVYYTDRSDKVKFIAS